MSYWKETFESIEQNLKEKIAACNDQEEKSALRGRLKKAQKRLKECG